MIRKNLLDLNVLIALTDTEHMHYSKAQRWFNSSGNEELGHLSADRGRVRPHHDESRIAARSCTLQQAAPFLRSHQAARLQYWPIAGSWAALTAPFADRIFGHQQVTDAYLLGLAIKESGVLVTFDRGLKYMAGPQFSDNLLVLE